MGLSTGTVSRPRHSSSGPRTTPGKAGRAGSRAGGRVGGRAEEGPVGPGVAGAGCLCWGVKIAGGTVS
ncbi:hypothetical protein Kpho01_13750 [Kitasatospora phosalacinea]|uniref:Uncharacterized protein n=1 Tax=Kitasatospora phosalacinea TaxID=2065 RepID=A0A9W6PCM4_9ACTN|nr:hypothetical protein Kpho01_13750 [Kitasatospora phosalacinea]